ncbi:MAG: anti-sigma factor antagonist [Actinomycetota bacterium]|nr:MAG: anti-sigma factor antagonist [Actinomycetota bacterium]
MAPTPLSRRVLFFGELDLSRVEEMRAAIWSHLQTPTSEIVVDLRDVTFLDSSAMSVLAQAHGAALTAGARFRVINVQRIPRRALEFAGVDRVLDVQAGPEPQAVSA